ncbi:MAG: 30S ribosomal protein S13, partial [Candidatus Brocadiae bacterium]|nr:30S ribosomal protein S13 [Candidatus Brocadiia bacterium]
MPRLVGVDIPAEKRIIISLTYIYGVGSTSAKSICQVLSIDPDKRAHELSEDELSRVASYIDKNFIIEGEL